jgi:hypothetical protein
VNKTKVVYKHYLLIIWGIHIPLRETEGLPCVYAHGKGDKTHGKGFAVRSRAHGSKLHGKDTLSCAFYRHARQSFVVRQNGRTAKNFKIH